MTRTKRNRSALFPVQARPHRNPLSDDFAPHAPCPKAVDWPSLEIRAKVAEWAQKRVVHLRNGGSVVPVNSEGLAVKGSYCVDAGNSVLTEKTGIQPSLGEKLRKDGFSRGKGNKARAGKDASDAVCDEEDGEAEEPVAEFPNVEQPVAPCTAPGGYRNVWINQENVMRWGTVNIFPTASLSKIFITYADPHYKKKHWRRRVVNDATIPEYAAILKPTGRLYLATDVLPLFEWMVEHLAACPLFQRLPAEVVSQDPIVPFILHVSEDAVRTEKRRLTKYHAVFERLPDPTFGF